MFEICPALGISISAEPATPAFSALVPASRLRIDYDTTLFPTRAAVYCLGPLAFLRWEFPWAPSLDSDLRQQKAL